MSTPTADGITVHRCVVRVIRRGGWSWGPDPRDLVRQVVNALPDLLADRFAEPLSGEGPDDEAIETIETIEITEPVTVTVRLPRGGPPAVLAEVLSDIVVEPTVPAPDPPSPAGERPSVAAFRPDRAFATPATLFGDLGERGELEPLLTLLPDETLRTYLTVLLGAPAAGESPVAEGTVAGLLAAEFARRSAPEPVPTARADLLRHVRSLPAGDIEGTEPTVVVHRASESAAPGPASSADLSAAAGPLADTAQPVPTGETRTCSALPFLLAGPLASTGYLDALGPALAGVDLLADAPLFAAALAYKVLGTPERGWRRTSADHATAAAFAGLDTVPDLGAFAHRVRNALPVLDGLLALNLCRGHDPTEPLLVTGADDGLLLADARGMFPIAWAPDVAALLPHWAACGRPSVAVCDSPLPADCLRTLAAAGVDLITGVRPLRGDPVTRLPWRTPLWTAGAPDPRLAAALPAHTARLTELVAAFTMRRAVPRADDGALDRTVLLAAATGLGLIAWTLWRERETPDPVLALTRFADLDATVRYGAETVHVRLPLGRRHADLLHHGLLVDVPDVVWLGGRTLTFSGG